MTKQSMAKHAYTEVDDVIGLSCDKKRSVLSFMAVLFGVSCLFYMHMAVLWACVESHERL
jgi:hypothetical protein